MAADELQRLRREFLSMTRAEGASIAKAMLEGAVRYGAERRKQFCDLLDIIEEDLLETGWTR